MADPTLEIFADDEQLTLYFVNMIVISASDLANTGFFDKADPYCKINVGGISDKTPVIDGNLNPVWNERMSFFLPKKPDKMQISVWDSNVNLKDAAMGEVDFEFNDMFENNETFDGELDLKDGSIKIKLRCRIMKPIETEVKLGIVEKDLLAKEEEQKQTVAALDESEVLRQEAISQLSTKEQEIIRQSEEIAEKQRLYEGDLSEKETQLLDQAQLIEAKIQEVEEAKVAQQETDLKRQEAETKLTEAEKEILRKAEELEEKERLNAEALTAKEKETLAAAEKLEEKENQYNEVMARLEQTDALRTEVENELTAKEKVILQQAKDLEDKQRENAEQMTAKEQELLAASQELAERDRLSREAQQKQDETQGKLDALMKDKERLEEEIKGLQSDLQSERDRSASEHKSEESQLQDQKKRNERLEEEVRGLKADLEKSHADIEKAKNSGCCTVS